MCLCHGFPEAEGQSMLGRVEKRRDRASRLGKGKGAVELRHQRGVHSGHQPLQGPAWSFPRHSLYGYLIQNPSDSIKEHLEEATLKERPFRLMRVQGCWAQGPTPVGHTGAALLELKQRRGRVEGPHKNSVWLRLYQGDIKEPRRGASHRTVTHQAVGIVHICVISVLLQEG